MSTILSPQVWLPTVVLGILFSVATSTDIRYRRIPNRLVLTGIGLAFFLHGLAWSKAVPSLAGSAWWSPLAGLAIGMLTLLPLYLLRACGAGDVKLMAMVGAFVGPATVPFAALYTLVAGGVLALLYMLVRGVAAQTLANVRFLLTEWMLRTCHGGGGGGCRLAPLAVTAMRLPYVVAIAAGTIVALLERAVVA